MEDDQSLHEVNATFRVKDDQEEEEEEEYHVPLVRESLNSKREKAVVAETEEKIVSTHELPAPYGCRSVATKGGRHFRTRISIKSPYMFPLTVHCPVWYLVPSIPRSGQVNGPSSRPAPESP